MAERFAVVTGASSGIGAGVAERFGRAGWRVCLVARREKELAAVAERVRAAGGVAHVAALDVADEAAVRSLASTLDALGPIHALVNNAGVGLGGDVEEMEAAAWDETFATNVRGTFLVTRLAIPRLAPEATIVNVASVLALEAAGGLSAYSASKSAVRGFSQSLGRELAGRGARVVCVNPGYVATTMVDGADHDFAEMIQPEDLAEIVWQACHQPTSVYVDEITVWPRKLYNAD